MKINNELIKILASSNIPLSINDIHNVFLEQNRAEMHHALVKLRSELSIITKDSEGYNYKYATYETIYAKIMEPVVKNGFTWSFSSKRVDQELVMTCTLLYKNGASFSSDASVTVGRGKGKSIEQDAGTAITYAKRYALCLALGLAIGDQDLDSKEATIERGKNELIAIKNKLQQWKLHIQSNLKENIKFNKQERAKYKLDKSSAKTLIESYKIDRSFASEVNAVKDSLQQLCNMEDSNKKPTQPTTFTPESV